MISHKTLMVMGIWTAERFREQTTSVSVNESVDLTTLEPQAILTFNRNIDSNFC